MLVRRPAPGLRLGEFQHTRRALDQASTVVNFDRRPVVGVNRVERAQPVARVSALIASFTLTARSLAAPRWSRPTSRSSRA